MAKKKASEPKTTANIGFEAKLWLAADKLRNNMDAAEYKHVVLGLIFLKYISDTFEEHRAKLVAGQGDYAGANPEDQDEYKAENVFWVPKEARWPHLQGSAKLATIGKLVDDAMVAIERDNPRLKGVLPKDYARPSLDKHRLGELIDLIGTIVLIKSTSGAEIAMAHLPPDAGEGDATGKLETQPLPSHRSVDLLGRVYEYFLTRFASAEGKNGGQFYKPGTKNPTAAYADVAGFCKSATTAEIAAHGHVLTPGRYVGAEEVEDDGDPFEEKMPRLVAELHAQFAESAKLEQAIKRNLEGLGYAR